MILSAQDFLDAAKLRAWRFLPLADCENNRTYELPQLDSPRASQSPFLSVAHSKEVHDA